VSAISECCSPCSQIQTVNVPGSPGAPGAAGFTFTTAYFTIPILNATVSIQVASTAFMTIGLNVFVGDANFIVTGVNSLTSCTLQYIGLHGSSNFPGDALPGTSVVSGSIIVAGMGNVSTPIALADGGTGVTSLAALATALNSQLSAILGGVPLPIVNGGTGGATIAAALAALGIAQTPTTVYASGTAYTLTASQALVAFGTTSPTITIPATGAYLLVAGARVDLVGATFAANQTVSLKLRRTAAVAGDIANAVAAQQFDIVTTKTYTTFRGDLPHVVFAATAADVIQLWGGLSATPSAGAVNVVEAWLIAIPLHLP
jgi:hypothetical protein